MRIIKKRLDELKPGEVVVGGARGNAIESDARDVVLVRLPAAIGATLVTFGRFAGPFVEGRPYFDCLADSDIEVNVEAPTLAEQHADELALRLGWLLSFVDIYARKAIGPATPEVNKCRAVLAAATGTGEPLVDYRVLLQKYIRHVVEAEGIDFISGPQLDDVALSAEEVEALRNLAAEVRHA